MLRTAQRESRFHTASTHSGRSVSKLILLTKNRAVVAWTARKNASATCRYPCVEVLEVDVAGQDHAPEVELFHACGLAAAIECQITIAR
jgi:hypothetical protein